MRLSDYMDKVVEEINCKTNTLSNTVGMGEMLELLRYQDLTEGKKLRSVLCVLVSDTLGGSHQTALDYAMAIEMTHQASLTHDDVVDGDMFRRKKLSMHERYGVGKAILFGDMLISFAVNALRDMSPIAFYRGGRVLADAWGILAQGAYMEHTMHKNPDEALYVKMIQCKTGILFDVACRLGVTAANGNDETFKMLSTYGMCVGTAFQVADDLVDVIRSVNKGKLVSDLKDRKVTLPLIYLVKMSDANTDGGKACAKYINREDMSDDEIKIFLGNIKTSGVIEASQKYVEDLINKAYECVSWINDGDYKSMLIELPEYAVKALMSEVHQ